MTNTPPMAKVPVPGLSAEQSEEKLKKKKILEACELLVEVSDFLRQVEDVKDIDEIFLELTKIDNRILQSQVGIDDLKMETREMLAKLHESIV